MALKSSIKDGESDFIEPIKFAMTEGGVESFWCILFTNKGEGYYQNRTLVCVVPLFITATSKKPHALINSEAKLSHKLNMWAPAAPTIADLIPYELV